MILIMDDIKDINELKSATIILTKNPDKEMLRKQNLFEQIIPAKKLG